MDMTRRFLLATAGGALVRAGLPGSTGLFTASSINHLALTVPDVAKAGDFYARVLGTRVISDMGERGQMRGLRRNYLALFKGERPGLNHFSPGVDSLDEPAAGAVLSRHGYEPFERAPGIWAVLDPDGIQNHLSETMRRQDEVDEAYKKDPAPESILRGVDVNHVALRVSDLGRSVEWYQALMGLRVVRRSASSAFLGLGGNFLALFAGQRAGTADHFCFSIEDYDPQSVRDKLARHGIESVQREDRIYFKDLNGLTVQVSQEDHQP